MEINTIIVLLVILIIFLLGFIYIEPILMKHKVKNDNEYGSARFATVKEIKKNFKKELTSNIKESGFPLYYSKDLKTIYFDRETPHYVYLGSTGSGKTVTVVLNECTFICNALKKKSVFITDPKGEIYQNTSKMFQDKGYKIITIDFRNPELSNKINILDPVINEYEKYIYYERKSNILNTYMNTLIKDNESYKFKMNNKNKKIPKEGIDYFRKRIEDNNLIIKNMKQFINVLNNESMSHYAETNRLLSSLSTMVMQEKHEQKDPFWNESAKNLLEGLIGFFLEEYKLGNITREKITMTSIRKFQNSSMEQSNFKKFNELIDKLGYDYVTKLEEDYLLIESMY